MYFKRNKFLVIVFIITLYFKRSASSPFNEKRILENASSSQITPIFELQSKKLGDKCLALPIVSKPSFRYLIENKCYVDKTEYLNKMIQRGEIFYFLSRPRRFGKTLLVDTIQAFFDGEEDLFKNTAIYQQFTGTSKWPKYPTVHLDFSCGISTRSHSTFEDDLIHLLLNVGRSHHIHLEANSVPSVTHQLIQSLSAKYNSSVVLLIDEYDSPYTRMFVKNKIDASMILETLQSFFSTLKGVSKNIHFCFVTGITRLPLSDFFSGFNSAFDLTMDPNYAGILGFNETELHQYFGGHIKDVAKAIGEKEENILNRMRKWYDGFQFSVKNESLYSPCSVIGYLGSNTTSTTSWSDTGGPSRFLVERLKEFPVKALEIFVNDKINDQTDKSKKRQVTTAKRRELTGKINFDDSTDSTALIALLFHSGYLRITSYDDTTDSFTLDFTNLELKEDYAERIYNSFTGWGPTTMENLLNSITHALDEHEWEPFIKKLNAFFSRIPYQLMANQRKGLEAWFHLTLYLIVHFTTYARAHRNEPSWEDPTNKGRADLVISIKDTTFVFEPTMDNNPENPLYECKEKYLHKYLFDSNKYVVCLGLKFLPTGVVNSWGTATFSTEGKLLRENGKIKLTT